LSANVAVAETAPVLPKEADVMRFGMDASSLNAQTQAGAKPDYGTMWIGPWTLTSGWVGPTNSLNNMRQAGVTPAIHFYYWGDDISPSCVEHGCWSSLHNSHKNRADWQRLAEQLVENLHKTMQGAPVVVLMETEFNKGGIENYEPFDGYLAEKSRFIKAGYPNAEIVLAFGNWNRAAWTNFSESAEASDAIGIQGMRGSTRNSLSSYQSLYTDTLRGAERAQQLWDKPVLILDIALSSYPDSDYLRHQATTLEDLFLGLERLQAAGVTGIIYRSWYDEPTKSLQNYYGIAERHWGLNWDRHSGPKPSGEVWVEGVQANREGRPYVSPLGERPFIATFTLSSSVNQWWMDTRVSGTHPIKSVEVSVNDSPFRALSFTNWETWASSNHVSTGSDVVLRATDIHGSVSSTYPFAWLQESPRTHVPEALSASFAYQVDNLSVSLDASGSKGSDLSHHWDLGDGTTASGPHVAHSYTRSGTYTVTLLIKNDEGTAQSTKDILVHAPPPVAAFNHQTEGLTVHLDASTSYDPSGRSLEHTWHLGDGITLTGPQVSHTYTASGTYTINLSVESPDATDSMSREITVTAPPPVASFTHQTEGLTVHLDASTSYDPSGRSLGHTWDLGDGTTLTGQRVTHAYAEDGAYEVTLRADNQEQSASHTQRVEVHRPIEALDATLRLSSNINQWWIEVYVDANHPVQRVQASINGGSWRNIQATDWGAWAASHHAPPGSDVRFRITDIHGQRVTTDSYTWLQPEDSPENETPALKAAVSVSRNVNEWWVEARVDANNGIERVQVRIDGGPWRNLQSTDWGSWARSLHAPTGSQVEFRVSDEHGQRFVSETFHWLIPEGPAPEPEHPPLEAQFRPASGINAWWIEVYVDANNPLDRVQARIDGGSWRTLGATDWGSWARSLHAPNGSQVEFRATDEHGQVAGSATYTW
jgi:PKD repeat protein